MGCPFKSLSCSIRSDGARILTWTMRSGAVLKPDWPLSLECSRAGGEWETLAENLQDLCCWVDTRRRNYNKRLDECYRLRLHNLDEDCWCVSGIVNAGNYRSYPFSPEAENVLRQTSAAIRNSGCPGVLLKRRLWGVRCPDCVDFEGQQTVNEHCPRCLGTGMDGGYFPGIGLWMLKDSIADSESPSPLGYLQGQAVTARCVAFPWIGRGDIWAEDGSDRRYVIDSASPAASYRQTTLIYAVRMHLVELDDVLHTDGADRLVENAGEWQSPRTVPGPVDVSGEDRQDNLWDRVLSEL